MPRTAVNALLSTPVRALSQGAPNLDTVMLVVMTKAASAMCGRAHIRSSKFREVETQSLSKFGKPWRSLIFGVFRKMFALYLARTCRAIHHGSILAGPPHTSTGRAS